MTQRESQYLFSNFSNILILRKSANPVLFQMRLIMKAQFENPHTRTNSQSSPKKCSAANKNSLFCTKGNKNPCILSNTRVFLEVPPRFELGNEGFAVQNNVIQKPLFSRLSGHIRVYFSLCISFVNHISAFYFSKLWSQHNN